MLAAGFCRCGFGLPELWLDRDIEDVEECRLLDDRETERLSGFGVGSFTRLVDFARFLVYLEGFGCGFRDFLVAWRFFGFLGFWGTCCGVGSSGFNKVARVIRFGGSFSVSFSAEFIDNLLFNMPRLKVGFWTNGVAST